MSVASSPWRCLFVSDMDVNRRILTSEQQSLPPPLHTSLVLLGVSSCSKEVFPASVASSSLRFLILNVFRNGKRDKIMKERSKTRHQRVNPKSDHLVLARQQKKISPEFSGSEGQKKVKGRKRREKKDGSEAASL